VAAAVGGPLSTSLRRHEQRIALGVAAAALLVLGAAPLVALLAEIAAGWRPALEALGSARPIALLLRSLALALAVTMLSLAGGIPLGVLVGRTDARGRGLALLLQAFPVFLPPFLLALGWFQLLGARGLAGSPATSGLLFSEAGVAFVLVATFTPIVTILVALGLQALDPSLEEAARVAARPLRVVARILLPAAAPAIALAALTVFSLSLSELGVPMFLRVDTFPAAVFARLGGVDYAPGEAIALVLPLAGLKATGRVGQTNFGGLVVRTREEPGVVPASTMAVVRVRQNVFAESAAGLIATLGDPLGRSGSWEVGADFTYQTSHLHGDKNFSAGVWGLATGRSDLDRFDDGTALGLKVDYPNDLWDCSFSYRRIGDGFDPSLGFVLRRGINSYVAGCTYAPRPKGTFIRQMFHEFFPTLTTDLHGRWESYRVFMAPVNWRLESGDRFELNVAPAGGRLTEPFEIVEGVVIPPGAYDWLRYRVEVGTAAKRKLSGQATWWFGGFYTGTLDQIEVEASWTPSPLLTFLVNAERNIGRLEQGDFDLTLVGTKVRLNLSPNLLLDSFLQYDTAERAFGTNTRLRWTFNPRGDLFVIYNHNLREIQDRWRRDANELLLKLQYTFRR